MSKDVGLMDNDASCKITGVGTVIIKVFYGTIRMLADVKHVPDLKRNFILLSTLDSKGYKYIGECGALKVRKCALVVMKGNKYSIYSLQTQVFSYF